MATKKKQSGNLADLIEIAFDAVKKKFGDKKVELKISKRLGGKLNLYGMNKAQENFWAEVEKNGREERLLKVEQSGSSYKATYNMPNIHALSSGIDYESTYLPLKVDNILNLKDYDRSLFDLVVIGDKYYNGSDGQGYYAGYYLKSYFGNIFSDLELGFYVEKTLVGAVDIDTSSRGGKGSRFELQFRDNERSHSGRSIVPKTIRSIIFNTMHTPDKTEQLFFQQKFKEFRDSYRFGGDDNPHRTLNKIDKELTRLVNKEKINFGILNRDTFADTLDKLGNCIKEVESSESSKSFFKFIDEYKDILADYNYLDTLLNKDTKDHMVFVNFVNGRYSVVSHKDGVYVRDYYDSPEDLPEDIRDKYSLLSSSDEDIFYVGFKLGDCYAVSLLQ